MNLLRGISILALLVAADSGPRGQMPFLPTSLGLVRTLAPRVGEPACLAFHPDGSRLAVGGTAGTIVIYSTVSWKQVARVACGPDNTIMGLEFSPDGRRLVAVAYDGTIWIAPASGQGAPVKLEVGVPLTAVAWASTSRHVYVGGQGGLARKIDVDTGNMIREYVPAGVDGWVHSVAISPDGMRLAVGSPDGRMRLFNAETGAVVAEALAATGRPSAVSFRGDGRVVACGQHDNSFTLYDIGTARTLPGGAGHTGEVADVRFTPDRRHIVTASADRTLRVWTATAPYREIACVKHHSAGILRLAISPGAQFLATLASDYQVKIWGTVRGGMKNVRGKGYLGVMVDTHPLGCQISEVLAGTAAERSGVQVGEILSTVGGEKVESSEEAIQSIGLHLDGDEVELELKDGAGGSRKLKVKLGPRPEP